MRRLGLEGLIDARSSRGARVVVAMVARRVVAPEAGELRADAGMGRLPALPTTSWASAARTRMSSTRPWTGSSNARRRSRNGSPSGA